MGKLYHTDEQLRLEFRVRIESTKSKHLDLAKFSLKTFPVGLFSSKSFSETESIDLSDNKFHEIPVELLQFKNLKKIILDNNYIEKIDSYISEFKQLEVLSLKGNVISTVSPAISDLQNLKSLNLSYNRLEFLPVELQNLNLEDSVDGLKGLELRGNSLNVPEEIYGQSTKSILKFIFNSTKKVFLNDVKLIVLGEGYVGKTAIIERLREDTFSGATEMTPGIVISKYAIPNTRFALNIWDFGGQEILHAMHQFFLTERSIYVFCWNGRENDVNNKIENWLKLICSFGNNSPIIFVTTRIDDGSYSPDERFLCSKYPNIVGFVRTSSKTGEGIGPLKELITRSLDRLEHLNDKIPFTWLEVKNDIETLNDDFISLNEFYKICENRDVKTLFEQNSLLRLLHDLGVCLNYGKGSDLLSTNVLNPEWITNSLYKILNSRMLFDSRGLLRVEDLQNILDVKTYPRHIHQLFIDIMQVFELCYPYSMVGPVEYIIPDLLSKDEPFIEFDFSSCLHFEYRYDYHLKSIFPRVIVKTQNLTNKLNPWRKGILLFLNNSSVLIKEDANERTIHVYVSSSIDRERISTAKIVRLQFDSIHKSIPKIECKLFVNAPGDVNLMINFEHARELYKVGILVCYPEGFYIPIHIEDIFNSIGHTEVKRTVNLAQAGNLPYIQHTLSLNKRELELLLEKKKLIDYEVTTRIKYPSIAFALLLAAFSLGLYGGYVYYNWDEAEPITYIIGIYIGIYTYLWKGSGSTHTVIREYLQFMLVHEYVLGFYNNLVDYSIKREYVMKSLDVKAIQEKENLIEELNLSIARINRERS